MTGRPLQSSFPGAAGAAEAGFAGRAVPAGAGAAVCVEFWTALPVLAGEVLDGFTDCARTTETLIGKRTSNKKPLSAIEIQERRLVPCLFSE